jgi:hypothetical protein
LAFFTPPVADNGSLAGGAEPGSRTAGLWRFYSAPLRGVNVLEYTDGTFEQTDAYPTVVDGVGKQVQAAYKGGVRYTVTTAQAARITAAGLGAYLS